MCGCKKHQDDAQPCDCICEEHRNFEAARDLAMRRYHVIVEVEAQRDAAQQQLAAIRKVLGDDWLRGRVLPRYVGAESDARLRAIAAIIDPPKTEEMEQ